jgi:hypothetical protein
MGDEMGEKCTMQGETNFWLETHKGTHYFENMYIDGRTMLKYITDK